MNGSLATARLVHITHEEMKGITPMRDPTTITTLNHMMCTAASPVLVAGLTA